MPGNVAPLTDERELLLAYLEQQRDGLRVASHGLTDEQAAAAPTAGTLSIGGLIKHVTATEKSWIDLVLQRPQPSVEDGQAAYGEDFRFGPGDSLAGVIAALDAQAAETVAVIGAIDDLGQPVPVPQGVPWFPDDVEAWTVRWVLLHLIEEVARHAGHADIVRESIDGATFFPLLAAVEGWPATPWLQPWSPG